MGMEAAEVGSRATPSGFRASPPEMVRDDSVQMLDNPHIGSKADLFIQPKLRKITDAAFATNRSENVKEKSSNRFKEARKSDFLPKLSVGRRLM